MVSDETRMRVVIEWIELFSELKRQTPSGKEIVTYNENSKIVH